MAYREATYASRDVIRRFSHAARFDVALELAGREPCQRVLDYGGGDGEFLKRLSSGESQPELAVNYEPFMESACSDGIRVARSWDEVAAIADDAPFDLVSCQEVMEHFSEQRQIAALQDIHDVLAQDGRLIISVPNESGPVAIVKNVGRWKFRHKDPVSYNYRNLAKSLFRIRIPECRTGDHYLNHMGFYYQRFERILATFFRVDAKRFSPFSSFPGFLSSQVFYVCVPR